MSGDPTTESTRGPQRRRDRRHERNRVRLIDAAIAVLLGDGMAGFSPTRIVAAAGLHKPAFYAHFKNVDECLEAVARHIVEADARASFVMTHSLERSGPIDDAAWIAINERALQNILDQADLYRVLLRYKYAENALGEAIRAMDREVFEHWTEYFWRLAVRHGVDANHFREIEHLAEHVVGTTYRAAERLLSGRVHDVRAEAERIHRYQAGIVTAEVRRMLGLPAGPGV